MRGGSPERPCLCLLLRAGASGPREAVIGWAVALGRSLDEAGGQPDSHNPGFSLWERQRQSPEGHRAVRMW